ncbi:MAG: hypothetical protein JNM39_07425 [Bdellovibrionaceae bacterium]|nr:hypothetical protein [Pseudobdellovibrionaceae bacterium]
MWKYILIPTIAFLNCILIGCATPNSSNPSNADLCPKLKGDLEYIHGSISKNFVGYVHNPELRQQVDQQFNKEVESSRQCSSNIDYVKSVRRYFSVFKDPHVGARWDRLEGARKDIFEVSTGKKAPEKSPSLVYTSTGIYLVNFNNQFFVKSKDNTLSSSSDIAIGDELISCEGKKPLDILENEILPFETVSAKDAAIANFTPNIFFRWDTKPDSKIECTFRNGKGSYTQILSWAKVSEGYLKEKFQLPPTKIYEIEKTPYGHWIKVKTFSDYNEEVNKQLSAFTEDAKNLRNDKIIVVDVRGNTGGNSSWGEAWAKNLYGYAIDLQAATNAVLASEDNTKHFERLFDHLKKQMALQETKSIREDCLQHFTQNLDRFQTLKDLRKMQN